MASQYTQINIQTAITDKKEFKHCSNCKVLIQDRTIYFILDDKPFCSNKCLTLYNWDHHDTIRENQESHVNQNPSEDENSL